MVSVPEWLLTTIISVAGSGMTVAVLFAMQFAKFKERIVILERISEKLHDRVDDLNKVTARLDKKVAIQFDREERRTPIEGVPHLILKKELSDDAND